MIALALVATGLAACGSLVDLPGKGPAAAIHVPRGAVAARDPAGGPPIKAQVVVQEPSADPTLDTDRIAVEPGARRVDYYAEARWPDRAPGMIQNLLLLSLENSGRLPAVGRPGSLAADVALVGELASFQASLGPGGDRVLIDLRLKLVRQPAGRVIATRTFTATRPVAGGDTARVVEAFEDALKPVMAEATAWVLASLSPGSP